MHFFSLIKKYLLLSLGLAGLGAIFFLASYVHTRQQEASYANLIKLPTNSISELVSGIYLADQKPLLTNKKIKALVVPHHLTASQLIAQGFKALSSQPDYKNIILISPDHFNACSNWVCLASADFQTAFGVLKTDKKTNNKLLKNKNFSIDNRVFVSEHGITTILPFLKYYLDKVSITPLILSQRLGWTEDAPSILAGLKETFNEHTVIIISSDFSHYLNLAEANEQDKRTQEIILSGNPEKAKELNNPAQSDCPFCHWLLMFLVTESDFSQPEFLAHSNSAEILNDKNLKETTSYFVVAYYEK